MILSENLKFIHQCKWVHRQILFCGTYQMLLHPYTEVCVQNKNENLDLTCSSAPDSVGDLALYAQRRPASF